MEEILNTNQEVAGSNPAVHTNMKKIEELKILLRRLTHRLSEEMGVDEVRAFRENLNWVHFPEKIKEGDLVKKIFEISKDCYLEAFPKTPVPPKESKHPIVNVDLLLWFGEAGKSWEEFSPKVGFVIPIQHYWESMDEMIFDDYITYSYRINEEEDTIYLASV